MTRECYMWVGGFVGNAHYGDKVADFWGRTFGGNSVSLFCDKEKVMSAFKDAIGTDLEYNWQGKEIYYTKTPTKYLQSFRLDGTDNVYIVYDPDDKIENTIPIREHTYRLKFYNDEHKLYPDVYSKTVSDTNAIKIVKKLSRHYKLNNPKIEFWGNRGGGRAYVGHNIIRISHNSTIGVICHELAHIYNFHKYGNCRHNKKLMKTLGRFTHYCESKNFWGMSQERLK